MQSANNMNLESSLCFPKDIFYAQTFDVDAFLSHYRREYTLERLRDDLTIFLKLLEMSMSELINKDYPDFVNLSTNLVDLDKAISEFKKPLETMKQEVDGVKNGIDSEIELITSKLNEKLMLEKRRIILKLLMNWQRSLKVTTEIIGNNSTNNLNSQKLNGDHIERIAFEFRQLKSSLSICSGEKNQEFVHNDEIDKLSQMLEKIMQDLFLSCLDVKDDKNPSESLDDAEKKVQLKHLLKSYSLLSKQRLAEQLFTDFKVKPYMEQYLNEKYLESNILKLNGVFDKCLEFIDQNELFLKLTCEIKSAAIQSAGPEGQGDLALESHNEFDFFLNSIWSQVVAYLDLNLGRIFSPADPDLFHQRYTQSFEFLTKFEQKCSLYDKHFKNRLVNSQTYKYFVKKWPTQFYFQIRFHEIVSSFEEDLVSYADVNQFVNQQETQSFLGQADLGLVVSDTLIRQLEHCWFEGKCFLKPLTSQFWKLSLQLVSRYCAFFIDAYLNKLSTDQVQQSSATLGVAEAPRSRTPTEQLGNLTLNEPNASSGMIQSQTSSSLETMNICILLLNDIRHLQSTKLPNFFDGVVAPIMRASNIIKDVTVLKEALGCSLTNLSELQAVLIQYIVKTQSEECLNHLKSANDIPRLYRRTNREVPKVPSVYVGMAVQVIFEFKQRYIPESNRLDSQYEILQESIRNIIDSVCIKFQSLANDLLESVKKMEDSLRRLRRVRPDRSTAANLSNLANTASASMSDDDKIRLQLYIDVTELGQQLSDRFDGYKGDSNFESLLKLVQESMDSKENKEAV